MWARPGAGCSASTASTAVTRECSGHTVLTGVTALVCRGHVQLVLRRVPCGSCYSLLCSMVLYLVRYALLRSFESITALSLDVHPNTATIKDALAHYVKHERMVSLTLAGQTPAPCQADWGTPRARRRARRPTNATYAISE